MTQVLYRKYRPKTFAEVIGQDVVKTILKNAISSARVSHAYLFAGPRGVGKTTVARLLAKAVNCLAPHEGEPDATCQNCQLLQEGRFLDLIEIDAASYNGVDNIREIIDHVKFTPSIGRYKVFIIDEVHMLSKAAFNALLKTLEEPPAHAIFILATTEIHKVPATIISRSQRFDFRRVSEGDIRDVLEKISLDEKVTIAPEALGLIARSAEGSLRDALSILDQLLSLGEGRLEISEVEEILGLSRTEYTQKFLDLLVKGEAAQAFAFVRTLASDGKDLVLFTRSFLEYLQLLLYLRTDLEKVSDLGFSAEEAKRLAFQAESLDPRRLLALIKLFLECYREIKTSPVPELPLLVQIQTFTGDTVPETPIKPEIPVRSAGLLSFSLSAIVDKWAEVLAKVKEYNHSLLTSLRLGRIVELKGLELILAFPYNFHKDTLQARKNRIVVEQVLEDVFGKPLKIKIYLERELTQPSGSHNEQDLFNEAIKVLGNNEANESGD